jgi:hypothetical protein
MNSRKFQATILVIGIIGFGVVWNVITGRPVTELLTALTLTLGAYCGANVIQDKITGVKK